MSARVTGRVQGVGFRAFVAGMARARGVTGWVRNRPDGAVEVVAEGPPAALRRLEADLRAGPRGARVADVAATWTAATGEFACFRVAG